MCAAFHRPVKDLGHDASSDAGEPTTVELGLPQNVGPQRGIADQLVMQVCGQTTEVDASVPDNNLVVVEGRDIGEFRHLLTAGEVDHRAAGEVAERKICLR